MFCEGRLLRKSCRFIALPESSPYVKEGELCKGNDFRNASSFELLLVAMPGVSNERRLIGIVVASSEFESSVGVAELSAT